MYRSKTSAQSWRSRRAQPGFTLIELLIVLMIFTIITALFITNYRRFGNNVTLSNVADEVALSIREMQTYGLASKRTSITNYDFRKAFGIYVNSSSAYQMFQDLDDDRHYDSGESVSQYTLPVGLSFVERCAPISSANTSTELHITFKRPDPDAKVYLGASAVKTSAALCLKSDQTNNQKTIVVLQSGQIEVVDGCQCN